MAETILKDIETGIKKVVGKVEEITGDVVEKIEDIGSEIVDEIKEVIKPKKQKTEKVKIKKAVKVKIKKDEEIQKEVEEIIKPEKKSKVIQKEVGEKKDDEELKVFDLYNIAEVKVNDEGLKNVINIDYKLVIKSHGRNTEKYGKTNVNIIERLINSIAVPGHRGKKHKIITKWASGKYNKNAKMVLEAFRIINEKTGENPIQVLVKAIENGAPRDEVTMIQYGGARYPQAVDCAPLRRISLALRNLVHGAYDKSFRSKKPFPNALADELIATSKGEGSVAVAKKTELEKQADAAR